MTDCTNKESQKITTERNISIEYSGRMVENGKNYPIFHRQLKKRKNAIELEQKKWMLIIYKNGAFFLEKLHEIL